MSALDHAVRPGHAFRRKQRREHAVARAVGRRAAFPHRELAAPRDFEREVGRDGERDGFGNLVARKVHDLRRRHRGRDRGVERVVHAALAHDLGAKSAK
jgi:hypothetical protein